MNSETRPESARSSIRSIVVGVDGSVAATSALAWAQQLLDDPDGVVHAVNVADSLDDVEEQSTRLEAVASTAGRPSCRVVVGEEAPALLSYADEVDADLLLIGTHDRSRIGPRTLGRLTSALIHQTDRPLGVVPEGQAATLGPSSTILVAVSHGRASASALGWATDLAVAHSARLSLFTAVPNCPVFRPDRLLDVLAYYVDPGLVRQWALEDLDEFAEQVQTSTTRELDIATSALFGSAGSRTVEQSHEADLLVTNLPRDGGWLGQAVPLAVRYALTHAPCPVVLVPDEPAGPRPPEPTGSQ